LSPHGLVLLVGIKDIGHEWLRGTIDDSPQAIPFALGLLFAEQLHLHVHEVDLLQQILDVFIFDVQIRIEAEHYRAATILLADAV
jgi:hypothetical protein